MFEHTRKKLTLMYSGMLALILLVVFFGSYWTLAAIIHRNEQAQLESIAEKNHSRMEGVSDENAAAQTIWRGRHPSQKKNGL